MAIEKKWAPVPPQAITTDGTQDGHITVPDTTLFYVKRKVVVFSDEVQPKTLEVKRINTSNDMELGPVGPINNRSDLTFILLIDNPIISAPDYQDRPAISTEDVLRAAYSNEPAVALRSLMVDKLGNAVTSFGGSPGFNLPEFDDVKKMLDPNDLPLNFKFFKNTIQVAQIDITYNSNGTSIEFRRSL